MPISCVDLAALFLVKVCPLDLTTSSLAESVEHDVNYWNRPDYVAFLAVDFVSFPFDPKISNNAVMSQADFTRHVFLCTHNSILAA